MYFKDIKTFVGLKKASQNHNQRKLMDHYQSTDQDFQSLEQLTVDPNLSKQEVKQLYAQAIAKADAEMFKQIECRMKKVVKALDTDSFFQVVDQQTGMRETHN